MNNDKDNNYLGELDIEHSNVNPLNKVGINDLQTIKPILPNNKYFQPEQSGNLDQTETLQEEPENKINNEFTQSAYNLVNKTLNASTDNNSAVNPNTKSSIYSSNPEIVNTNLLSSNNTSLNIDNTNNPDTINKYPIVDKPLYGGVVDSNNLKDSVTNRQTPKKPFYKNKKIFIFSLIALFIAILVVVGIFFIYLPNTPDSVWKTGLKRTGQQSSSVIDAISSTQAQEALKNIKLEAKGTIVNNNNTFQVSANSVIDENNSETTAQLQTDNRNSNLIIDTSIKTMLPASATFPNTYIKIGINDPAVLQSLNVPEKYNNSWISIEQDYIKELLASNQNLLSENNDATYQDYINVIKDVNAVTKDYIFSSNPENSIIEKRSYLGKDKIDEKTAYHYKAGVNKINAKKYCTNLVETMLNNISYKKIVLSNDSNLEAKKQEDTKNCVSYIDDIPDHYEFDVWINKSIKIIQRLRFYEDLSKQNKELEARRAECIQTYGQQDGDYCRYIDDLVENGQKYQEFGQTIKNKKELSIYTSLVSDTNKDKYKYLAELSANSNTYEITGKIIINVDNPNNKTSADLSFTSTKLNEPINPDMPQNAIPIQQLINEINFDPDNNTLVQN